MNDSVANERGAWDSHRVGAANIFCEAWVGAIRAIPDEVERAGAVRSMAQSFRALPPLVREHLAGRPEITQVVSANLVRISHLGMLDERCCELANIAPLMASENMRRAFELLTGEGVCRDCYTELHQRDAFRELANYMPSELFERAVAVAQRFEDKYVRVDALHALVMRRLERSVEALGDSPESAELQKAVDAALEIARSLDSSSFAATFCAFAEAVPFGKRQALMGEALAAASGIERDELGQDELGSLMESFPDDAIDAILGSAWGVDLDIEVGRRFVSVGPLLAERARASARRRARSLRRPAARMIGLAALIPPPGSHDREQAIREVLAMAEKIENPVTRLCRLLEIVEAVPREPLFTDALVDIALDCDRTEQQTDCLLRCRADQLSRAGGARALRFSLSVEDENVRERLLARFATYTPPGTVAVVLRAGRRAVDPGRRALILAGLAHRLSATERREIVEEALEAVRRSDDPTAQLSTLQLVAHVAPADLLRQAFDIASCISDPAARMGAIESLAAQMRPNSLDDVRELANQMPCTSEAWRCAFAFAPQIPPRLLATLSDAFVAAIGQMSDNAQRANVLAQCAAQLHGHALDEVLTALRDVEPAWRRQQIATDLAARSAEAACFALDGIDKWDDECSSTLVAIADRLPQDRIPDALTIAEGIPVGWLRAEAIAALAARVAPGQRPRLIEMAMAIDDVEAIRSARLQRIAERLPRSLISEALEIARDLSSPGPRLAALVSLADQLEPDDALWLQATEDAIEALQQLPPAASLLGSVRIADVLPPSDPTRGAIFRVAIDTAARVELDDEALQSLAALAHRAPDECVGQLFQIVATRSEARLAVVVLILLAQRIPEELLSPTIDIAETAVSNRARLGLLNAIAHRVPHDLVDRVANLAATSEIPAVAARVIAKLAASQPAGPLHARLAREAATLAAAIDDTPMRDRTIETVQAILGMLGSDRSGPTRKISPQADGCVGHRMPHMPESAAIAMPELLSLDGADDAARTSDDFSRLFDRMFAEPRHSKHRCACCGYRTIESAWAICEICQWEDNIFQTRDPDQVGAPNESLSLNLGRSFFESFGTCDPLRPDAALSPRELAQRVRAVEAA